MILFRQAKTFCSLSRQRKTFSGGCRRRHRDVAHAMTWPTASPFGKNTETASAPREPRRGLLESSVERRALLDLVTFIAR